MQILGCEGMKVCTTGYFKATLYVTTFYCRWQWNACFTSEDILSHECLVPQQTISEGDDKVQVVFSADSQFCCAPLCARISPLFCYC